MDFLTAKQAAEKWGITPNRVTILCNGGKIPGAVHMGKQWMIPNSTEKPVDGRTRKAKNNAGEECFRFPLYINFNDNSFSPPLSEEEKALRTAQIDFFGCDFEKAKKEFDVLCKNSENRYVRMSSLFFMCITSAAYNAEINFLYYFNQLNSELAKDFPNKNEMGLLRPWMNGIFGMYKSASEYLNYDVETEFHSSVYYFRAYLSFFKFIPEDVSDYSEAHFEVFELLCRKMEEDKYFFEAQMLHYMLFVSYMMTGSERLMLHHLKQIIAIAYEHGLLYAAADLAPYYPDAYKVVLSEYPKDFAERLKRSGAHIYNNFAVFNKKYNTSNLYTNLGRNDYLIILYVSQKYSNKKIAEAINHSERTVANMLSNIYATFGVKNKQELLKLINEEL